MKTRTYRSGLMAILGAVLAWAVVSYFRQHGRKGSHRFAHVKRMTDDVAQGVAEVWPD